MTIETAVMNPVSAKCSRLPAMNAVRLAKSLLDPQVINRCIAVTVLVNAAKEPVCTTVLIITATRNKVLAVMRPAKIPATEKNWLNYATR